MVSVETLLAYIPSRLYDLLKKDPAPFPDPPWEERFTGAVLFVDVSGFTPLSEVLTRSGPAGTEQLTDILNRSYEWLVDGVEGAGGYVAHFNGDAITAVIPAASVDAAFRAAVRCGLDLIRTAYRHPPEVVGGIDFPLRVKVGVSAGSVYAAAIGSKTKELRYFLAGNPVMEAAAASSLCGPMELLVPRAMMSALPPDVTTMDGPDGYMVVLPALLKRVPGPIPVRKHRTFNPEDQPPMERIARFVPEVIHERLMLGLSDLVAEHRSVLVLFARFEGRHVDAPGFGPALQSFMAEVFEHIAAHNGTVDKVEQADKGNLVMGLFGAPRALERAEEAAMACALELRDHLAVDGELRMSQIGINAGLVYAGGVGSRWRYDYTVMGDAVNVASRLMSAARPGEILVADRVRDRAPDWQYGQPRNERLKGRASETRVWPLLSVHQSTWSVDSEVIELPDRGDLLIGREADVIRLVEAVQKLQKGQGGIVVIEGEMGLGKTRLAEFVASKVFDFGEVLEHSSRPLVGIPYGHWQGPLLDLFEGEKRGIEQRVEAAFREVDPEFVPWLSLLNTVLGTTFPPGDVVSRVERGTRELKLQDMVTEVLLHRARRMPIMVVLEDFHDADSASAAMLRRLVSRLGDVPILVLVLTRTSFSLPDDPLPVSMRIVLSPLDRPRIQSLVTQLVGHEVPEAVHNLVWEKSQGNPLFAEELLHTLKRAGHLRRTPTRVEPVSPDALDVPDSLRSLLQSRIDELPEAVRAVAKVAAVVGNRFTLPTLAAGFKEGMDSVFLAAQLKVLIDTRIMTVSEAHPEPFYEFRHVLSREVIYSTMTQGQLEELHRRIGTYLETSGERVSPGVLAHHFELGRDYPRAVRYHIEAARQAFDTYANEQVIRGYERALELADEQWLPLPEGVSRAQILEALGDAYFRTGAYRKAESLFRKVRGIASDWLSVVRCLRKEGEARCRGDDIPNALRCFNEALLLLRARRGWNLWGVAMPLALRVLKDLWFGPPTSPGEPVRPADRDRYVEIDQVHAVMGIAYFYEGSRKVIEAVFRMVQVARRLGEPPRIARAYAAVAFLYANLSWFGLARRYADAAIEWLNREPDEAIRIQMRATSTYALVGATARLAADWDQAEAMQLKGLAVSQAIGDVWEEGVALMNLANIWRIRGYHHRAIGLHRRIMKLGHAREPNLYLGEALVADGLSLAELGRFKEAQGQLERALALPTLHIRSRVRAIAYRGWSRYLQGRLQAALSDMDQACRIIAKEEMVGDKIAEILVFRAEVVAFATGSRLKRGRAIARAARVARGLPTLAGCVPFVRGLAAAKDGRRHRAADLFARAAERFLHTDRGREAARALLWQASVDHEKAPALLETVRKLIRERGLPVYVPGSPK